MVVTLSAIFQESSNILSESSDTFSLRFNNSSESSDILSESSYSFSESFNSFSKSSDGFLESFNSLSESFIHFAENSDFLTWLKNHAWSPHVYWIAVFTYYEFCSFPNLFHLSIHTFPLKFQTSINWCLKQDYVTTVEKKEAFLPFSTHKNFSCY